MYRVLASSFSYLRIKHKAKRWVDWYYPAMLAALSTTLIFTFGGDGAIAGDNGLLDRLLLVSSVLPGFYIASLAAIATFNKPDIDQLMPSPAPTLVVLLKGNRNTIRLTRRRFLSHLFAFLCSESLALMIVCVFTGLCGSGLIDTLPPWFAHALTILFTFTVLLSFWQMVCVTCLGLYYLGDRLHHPTY